MHLLLRFTLVALLLAGFVLGLFRSVSAQNLPTAQVTGEAIVLAVDDFESHQTEVQYYVRDKKTGKAHALEFTDGAPGNFRSGARVTATGTQNGDHISLRGADVRVEPVGGASIGEPGPGNQMATPPTLSSGPGAATVYGASGAVIAQRVIVMLVNFRDAAIPCNRIGCDASVFAAANSVRAIYKETSYGRVSYSGTTVGPFTISASSTDACRSPYLPTLDGWASQADAQAKKAGVNLGGYTEKVYLLPYTSRCGGFKGYSTIGGSPGMAFIFACNATDLIAHEMGHNLGMNHASRPGSEYGDHSDIMGISMLGLRGLDAAHRDEFGWIRAQTVTRGGTYSIAPLELNPATTSLPQALKIYKADTHEYYYFSLREPLGYDAILPRLDGGVYTNGVSVHRFAGSNAHTYFLQGLTDGGSFVDTYNKITAKQLSHGATGARVTVSMGHAAPTVMATTLSYAAQSVGTASGAQAATFTNTGGVAMTIDSVGITGVSNQDFLVVSNSCGASLEPGASCTVDVKFKPTRTGVRSAYVALADESGTHEVSLSGSGQ